MIKTVFLRILLIVFVIATSLNAEGLNTGSMIDPNKTPSFNSCRDIASIVQNKPALLQTYTQPLEESGLPAYAVKGPVEIDVRTGTVTYSVVSSLNSSVAEKPAYINKFCTEVDQNALQREIDQQSQGIRQEIKRMYDSADALYDQSKKDSESKNDSATKSALIAEALTGNVADAQKTEEKLNRSSGQGGVSNSIASPHLSFMARINSVNNKLQTLIFLGVILITLIGLGAGYISKKVQKISDHEDYVARFGLGIIMWLLLFAPASTSKYNGGEISQTRMQMIWGWMLSEGTNAANELAGAAHHEQMRYAISESGGKKVEAEIATAVKNKAELKNKEAAYESLLHQCIQSYKVNDLMMAIGDSSGMGKRYFPTNESSVKKGDENIYSRYLQPTVDQNGVYVSLSSCGKAESEYRALVSNMKSLDETIQSGRNVKFQEKYTLSARQAIQDSTSAGWIGIAMLPIHHFIASGTGRQIEHQLQPFKEKEKEKEESCEEKFSWSTPMDRLGCHLTRIERALIPDSLEYYQDNFSNLTFDQFMSSIAQRSTLLLIPGASTVMDASYKLISAVIPIPFLDKVAASVLSFFISTDLALIVIQNLPFLVIIPAISIVIALYYAEVFFYSVTIPYVAAYAFSRDQWGHLIKHAVRGIMIALKPAMIVISVYTSIYVSDKITGITNNMIEKQTSLLRNASQATKGSDVSFLEAMQGSVDLIVKGDSESYKNTEHFGASIMGKFTIFIIQGLLMIISSILSVFIVIKIIISGPVMIMEMFGIREADMASQMTENITSRGQKFEGGI